MKAEPKTVLRETKDVKAERSARGVRLTIKCPHSYPKSRVVPLKEWKNYLAGLSNKEFSAACVLDYGIGIYARP